MSRRTKKSRPLVDLPIADLIKKADEKRRGLSLPLDVCTITNAKSGLCTEDCKFCAQSSFHSADIEVYPLKTKEIMVKEALLAHKNGAKSFGIVTSGNALTEDELRTIQETCLEIRRNTPRLADARSGQTIEIRLCASLGALSEKQLKRLKAAGLSRYHHNIETSRNFYPKIVSTHTFDERVATIKAAKSAGLEVCSGGIIGLGESWQDRLDMAATLKELEVDSVPINILVPVKGTAMEKADFITPFDAVRTIAIFRILLGNVTIKVAAGRETVMKDYQAMCFAAGANGMLIGGYLTTRGRSVEEDKKFIREIGQLWKTG